MRYDETALAEVILRCLWDHDGEEGVECRDVVTMLRGRGYHHSGPNTLSKDVLATLRQLWTEGKIRRNEQETGVRRYSATRQLVAV